jgi:hypothetical protein
VADDIAKQGVWITFHYAPYEGCWEIVPHASAENAAAYMSHKSFVPRIQFVRFGEELQEADRD